MAKAQKAEALTNNLAYQSLGALREGNRSLALQLAMMGYQLLDSNNLRIRSALMQSYYSGVQERNSQRFSLPTQKFKLPPDTPPEVLDIQVSIDGRFLVAASGTKLLVWDIDNENALKSLKVAESKIQSIIISQEGQQVLVHADNGLVELWSLATGQKIKVLEGRSNEEEEPKETTLGSQYFISRMLNGTGPARILDNQSGELVSIMEGLPPKSTTSIFQFTNSGNLLVTASANGRVQVWQPGTGRLRFNLNSHKGPINKIAISENERYLATASEDKTIVVWSLRNGRKIRTLRGFDRDYGFKELQISGDGQFVFTITQETGATLWEVRTGSMMYNFIGEQMPVEGAVFHSNDRLITTSSNNIAVRELRTGKTLQRLEGFQEGVSKTSGNYRRGKSFCCSC